VFAWLCTVCKRPGLPASIAICQRRSARDHRTRARGRAPRSAPGAGGRRGAARLAQRGAVAQGEVVVRDERVEAAGLDVLRAQRAPLVGRAVVQHRLEPGRPLGKLGRPVALHCLGRQDHVRPRHALALGQRGQQRDGLDRLAQALRVRAPPTERVSGHAVYLIPRQIWCTSAC